VFPQRPEIALAVAHSVPKETKADNALIFEAGVGVGIPVMVPGVFRDCSIGRSGDLFLFDWLKPQS
jgi:hypothetical protein